MQLHKRVVVVDDDKKIVILLEKILTKMGCRTYKALTGKDALKLVQNERPDLLISDMYIPDIQGGEIVRKIRGVPELNGTKIILMTAVYKELSIEADLRELTDGFIAKPLDVQKLVQLILDVL
ncbi:MAG: response regulator [bacterium]|nr:response regulator [bacterium]